MLLISKCSCREDAQTLDIAVAMYKARQSAASSGNSKIRPHAIQTTFYA